MTKQTIEVEGLPEGCEAVEVHFDPNYFNKYTGDDGYIYFEAKVKVKKIQPRRIVLEETNEERRICFGEWYESQEGKLMRWPYGGKTDGKHKVWREVKETNAEPKLSLNVAECKSIIYAPIELHVKLEKFIKENS